jgi:hypothetical protein
VIRSDGVILVTKSFILNSSKVQILVNRQTVIVKAGQVLPKPRNVDAKQVLPAIRVLKKNESEDIERRARSGKNIKSVNRRNPSQIKGLKKRDF